MKKKRIRPFRYMVVIVDGNSEHVAHISTKTNYNLICLTPTVWLGGQFKPWFSKSLFTKKMHLVATLKCPRKLKKFTLLSLA